MNIESQVTLLYAVVNHYLDSVPLDKIEKFKGEFLTFLHREYPELGAEIAESGELDEREIEILKRALDEFISAFSAKKENDHGSDA